MTGSFGVANSVATRERAEKRIETGLQVRGPVIPHALDGIDGRIVALAPAQRRSRSGRSVYI